MNAEANHQNNCLEEAKNTVKKPVAKRKGYK